MNSTYNILLKAILFVALLVVGPVAYALPPITGAATAITPTSATLNGTFFSGARQFNYSTSPVLALPSTCPTVGSSCNITGLSPDTIYYFQANDLGGGGAILSFSTSAGGGTTAPLLGGWWDEH